jgi:hypothetical protein
LSNVHINKIIDFQIQRRKKALIVGYFSQKRNTRESKPEPELIEARGNHKKDESKSPTPT